MRWVWFVVLLPGGLAGQTVVEEGLTYLRTGQYGLAEAHFAQCSDSPDPSLAQTCTFHRARTRFLAGRPDQALPLLETYLQQNPSDFSAWRLQAQSYEAVGNLDAAHYAYAHILQVLPDSLARAEVIGLRSVAWQDLAEFWQRQDAPQRALAAYDSALATWPGNLAAAEARGFLLLMEMNRTVQAWYAFDAILKKLRDRPSAWYGRGEANRRLGRLKFACQDFAEAAERAHPQAAHALKTYCPAAEARY